MSSSSQLTSLNAPFLIVVTVYDSPSVLNPLTVSGISIGSPPDNVLLQPTNAAVFCSASKTIYRYPPSVALNTFGLNSTFMESWYIPVDAVIVKVPYTSVFALIASALLPFSVLSITTFSGSEFSHVISVSSGNDDGICSTSI